MHPLTINVIEINELPGTETLDTVDMLLLSFQPVRTGSPMKICISKSTLKISVHCNYSSL